MLSTRASSVEKLSLNRSNWCILPCFQYCPLLTFTTDMMPEERWANSAVWTFIFHQIRPITIQFCVCVDCFILKSNCQHLFDSNSNLTHSHCSIITFMSRITWIQSQGSHKIIFWYPRTNTVRRHDGISILCVCDTTEQYWRQKVVCFQFGRDFRKVKANCCDMWQWYRLPDERRAFYMSVSLSKHASAQSCSEELKSKQLSWSTYGSVSLKWFVATQQRWAEAWYG